MTVQKQPIGYESSGQRPTRRAFLSLSAVGLLMAGCSSRTVPGGTTEGTNASSKLVTIDELLATTPFHIAHRGSGDNWTEHTMKAYSEAIGAGAKAIEVSVHMTADGVLVCHHDTNLLRMTGVDKEIASLSYSDISVILNDARAWLGPAATPQAIPALRNVLDTFAARNVIFIEDKTGSHARELLDLMDSYPNAQEHFVWKQTAASGQYKIAAQRGYKTWGYFIDNSNGQFERYASRFDYLGIYHGASDSDMRQLVAYGAPVICWEVHTRWMRDRVLALGVRGLMCSNYPYVSNNLAQAVTDSFGSGLRAAGDLPWILAWKYQPKLRPSEKALRIDSPSTVGYQMGSLGPITKDDYSISFDLRWPDEIPKENEHAGLAFALKDDQPYRAPVPGTVGGYHVVLRTSGQVQLFRRNPGADPGDPIAGFMSSPPVPGQWVSIKVEVSPRTLRFARTDGTGWSKDVEEDSYRGGYVSLNKNYPGSTPVEFRNIKVT